jgi:tetratricopeptide (TPR) repeat protein
VSLKARACCLQGNALRLQRRFVDAGYAFDQAAYVLAGPLDLPERAEFLEKLGLLKADLGRVDEALALLWRAGYLWGQEADLHRQGVCLAWVGLLYLDHEDMERALPALVQARIAIVESAEPALACRVRLGLALCHAAQGRGATAERFVKEARQLYARVKDETRLSRFRWVEGKIAAQAGELAQALELLLAVRRGLIREGQLHEAALATLDLALVLARLERWEEIHPLVHELVEAFPNDPATNGAVIALGAFEALARGREDLRRARALAAGYLRRMRRRGLALEEA